MLSSPRCVGGRWEGKGSDGGKSDDLEAWTVSPKEERDECALKCRDVEDNGFIRDTRVCIILPSDAFIMVNP